MSIEALAKDRFCKLIGATEWAYPKNPSYYYKQWESYLGGRIPKEWQNFRYYQQLVATKFMWQLIHDIYCEINGLIIIEE